MIVYGQLFSDPEGCPTVEQTKNEIAKWEIDTETEILTVWIGETVAIRETLAYTILSKLQ